MISNAVATESCDDRSSSTIVHSPRCSRIAAASPVAFASARVVSTTKKPSRANFWAIAPPTPQRAPTGIWLSSSTFPWASFVLRPSDCHLEVAPTTTATGLPLLFFISSLPFPAPPGTQRFAHHQPFIRLAQPRQLLGEHRHALRPGARHLADIGPPEHAPRPERIEYLP